MQVEREAYEVIVVSGKLLYKKSEVLVETPEGTKWIFVLGTSRKFYVAEKKKGVFQHSSFLAGGATIAAGRLVARNGILEVNAQVIFYAAMASHKGPFAYRILSTFIS